MVADFVAVCEEQGYVKPSVYQGLYNLLSRESEKLFPLLRRHGIAFHAYRYVTTYLLLVSYLIRIQLQPSCRWLSNRPNDPRRC